MLIKATIVFVSYYLISPILFFLGKMLKRELSGGRRNLTSTKNANKGELRPTLSFKERLRSIKHFAFREHPSKVVLVLGYIFAPFFHSLVYALLYKNLLIAVPVSFFLHLLYVAFLVLFVKKAYDEEQQLIHDLLLFKRTEMGAVDNRSNIFEYNVELTIDERDEERNPTKITFFYPITFSEKKRTRFVGELCEKFGRGGIWLVSKENGWESGNRSVTFVWSEFFGEMERLFIKNFLDFKIQNMKLRDNDSTIYTYTNEFEVLEWSNDKKPERIRLYLPVGYNPLNQDTFLDNMSTQFGRGRPWEVDEKDEEYPGWNADNLIATLKLEAPLPDFAPWHERYLLNDRIQWSFFPLGIGSKLGVPLLNEETGVEEHIVGFDVNGAQGKWCKKNGIYVGKDLMPAPHAILCGVTGGGKSVCQRDVILGCLLRPKDWLLFIIDMKKVEGAMWRKYGVIVATSYEDAALWLSYAQTTMMDRFAKMEKLGINDWGDMPEEERGQAIMINVDEISELLAPIKGKSEEDKQNADFQAICNTCIESIARLGRAARVHLIVAGQRPDSEVVSMQIRQNCPVRLGAGSVPLTISSMIFESTFGATIPSSPQGRIGIKIHSMNPMKAQGFFAHKEWLDEYLAKNNLPTEIYESQVMQDIYAKNMAEAMAEGMEESDFDMIESTM